MTEQLEMRLEKIIPGSIIWNPHHDISTLELAYALQVLLLLYDQPRFAASLLSNQIETIRRHFIYKVES